MTSLAVAAQTVNARPSAAAVPGSVRPALLDPRPLQRHRLPAASPLTSPTFWLASAIVLPLAGVMRLMRTLG